MSRYIVISQQFAEAHANHRNGPSQFGYGVTKDGRYVCAEASRKEFPDLFSGDEEVVELSREDFPAPDLDE